MQIRPALIVSTPVGPGGSIFWSMMITSAERSAWPGDISLRERHLECGLPRPCVIRTEKIATLEAVRVLNVLGPLPADLWTSVRLALARYLHFSE